MRWRFNVLCIAFAGVVLSACSTSTEATSTASIATQSTVTPSSPTTTAATTKMLPTSHSSSAKMARVLPTLGTAHRASRGFGTVRPTIIDNGGDPTGLLLDVTWFSWGGPTAMGTGTGFYQPPNATVSQAFKVRAEVEAFDLGTCNGKPAYLHVQWWYPSKGQTFHPT